MKQSAEFRHSRLEVVQPLVKDLMTRELVTLTEEDTVKSLRDIFELKRVRHVPITNEENALIGPNLLQIEKKATLVRRILGQFKSPVVIVLLVASAVSTLLGETADAIDIAANRHHQRRDRFYAGSKGRSCREFTVIA